MPEKKKQELKDRAPIVAAYLRVSTDKQTILNQKSEVINFCHRQELKITMWCTETVSGTKKESERELGILLKKLQKGDVLIITKGSLRAGKLFEHEQEIKDLRTEGFSFQKIAMRYKVSPETVRLFYLRTLLKKPKKTPEEEIQEQNPIEKPET